MTGNTTAAPRVVMCVENLSVPTDRRVWQEATTLNAAGYRVDVICPVGKGRDMSPFELRESVRIFRYRPFVAEASALSYVREYGVALWRMRDLVRKGADRGSYDIVHLCNPPDFLWVAALGQRVRGAAVVFDHHDLAPELFATKFGSGGIIAAAVASSERCAFHMADVVLSTNESYKRIAMSRGRKDPDRVFVVRNAPDLRRFQPASPDPHLAHGRRFLIGYVGVMGPQDGVEHALLALHRLRERRRDWHAVFLGDGPDLGRLRELSDTLGLAEHVEFAGWATDEEILPLLSSADLCLSPETANPLNNRSTMMKVAEYMAVGRPVAAFDLLETRRTAGDCALYAPSGDVDAYAANIDRLLEDGSLRHRLGAAAAARVRAHLGWDRSAAALLAAYSVAAEVSRQRKVIREGRPRAASDGHAATGRVRHAP